MQESF